MTLNSKADKPVALISRSIWNFGVLVFVEGGKPENPEKNQGHSGGRRAFSPARTTAPFLHPVVFYHRECNSWLMLFYLLSKTLASVQQDSVCTTRTTLKGT